MDGVATMDPRNPAVSQSNSNSWSLVVVPGSEWIDVRDVPHGVVAAGKAKPMIVVMPAGHTRPFAFGGPPPPAVTGARDEFVEEFLNDIMPYVEKHYRVLADRKDRAIAGLSMGGGQTLSLAISRAGATGFGCLLEGGSELDEGGFAVR